jgi:hypothetical protein
MGVDVKPRTANRAGLQCFDQCILINNFTARGVDQIGIGLDQRDPPRID